MEFKNFENSYRTNFYIKTATGDIHNFKNGHKHNIYTRFWNELKYFNGCDAELTIYPTEINQNSKPQYMKIKRGSLVLFPKHSKYSLKYINVHNISPTVYRVAMQMIDPVTNDEFAFERNPYIITDATPLSIIDQMKIITTSSGSLYQDEHLFYSDIHLLWHLIYNTLYPTKNSTGNIKNILLYIEKNPNIMPSNKELADLCHVSVSTITRWFKKRYNISPLTYVINFKIEIAKKKLSNQNMTINRISSDLGFNSSEYFCKLFKKNTGMTPSEYRKSKKQI